MQMLKRYWFLFAALLIAVLLGIAWMMNVFSPSATVKYKTVKIDRGTISASVSASGTINPVTSVSVGSQVSGQIKEVSADFNSVVKANQIIARIDPDIFEYRVRQAQADLDNARAQQLVTQSTLSARRADLNRAQLNLNESKNDAVRKQTLFDKQFISTVERDKADSVVKSQLEDLAVAMAQLDLAQAQISSAKSTVAQRQAALDSARADLAKTVIRSPVDGVVIKRSIEMGQTVAASLQAPELFVIAKNLRDMQVDTAVDESDIGKISEGMKAAFTVDSFPGRTFNGAVKQVRKSGQTVQNVVTYTVVVGFVNEANQVDISQASSKQPGLSTKAATPKSTGLNTDTTPTVQSQPDSTLLPGMTANVRIITAQRQDVLRAPMAALRFRPANETVKQAATKEVAVANADSRATAGAYSGSSTASGSTALRAAREKLEQTIQATDAQRKQLDDIYAGMRDKFAALRELPEDQRPKAMAQVRAQIQAKIMDILTTEQKSKYELLLAQSASKRSENEANSSGAPATIYVLGQDGKPKAVAVRTGISDGSVVELKQLDTSQGALKEGDEVIVGTVGAASSKPSTGVARPAF